MGQVYPYTPGQQQEYAKYTDEDFKVWKILYDRQMPNLPCAASEEFLRGLDRIKFNGESIPSFEETNNLMRSYSGWEVVVVPGLIADDIFFELLSNKKFPASTWLRKMNQIDYLQEPDMFHDVFAHVPLLTNVPFTNFLKELSVIALEHINDKWAIEVLSRIYWFTVEFGLIKENGENRIYGAGILSSAGETKYCLSNEAKRYDYDVAHILSTSYRKDVFQKQYWVIESYEQLFNSIPEIRVELTKLLDEVAH